MFPMLQHHQFKGSLLINTSDKNLLLHLIVKMFQILSEQQKAIKRPCSQANMHTKTDGNVVTFARIK